MSSSVAVRKSGYRYMMADKVGEEFVSMNGIFTWQCIWKKRHLLAKKGIMQYECVCETFWSSVQSEWVKKCKEFLEIGSKKGWSRDGGKLSDKRWSFAVGQQTSSDQAERVTTTTAVRDLRNDLLNIVPDPLSNTMTRLAVIGGHQKKVVYKGKNHLCNMII